MRRLAFLVCAVFVSGLVMGGLAPALASDKTHEVITTVVSVDVEKKTITFNDDKGAPMTEKVLDKAAVDALRTLREGDKVQLSCRDKENGAHEGITGIKILKS